MGRPRFDLGPPALPAAVDRVAERWWSLAPRYRWAAGLLAAVLVLLAAGAGAARSPWGPPRPVLVAARDRPAGHPLAPGDLEVADWPAGLVPDDALDAAAEVPDGRLRGALTAGTPLSRRLVARGIPDLVGDGEVAYALPRDTVPALEVGQVLDLVGADGRDAGHRIATAARVLAVDEGHVWLAVGRDDAPSLAAASGRGGLTAVLLPR